MFNTKAIDRLSQDLQDLSHRIDDLLVRQRCEYDTLDEYDSMARAKIQALAEHCNVALEPIQVGRTLDPSRDINNCCLQFQGNTYKFHAVDLKDNGEDDITTNNQ